jgi:hypothetical protein
VVKHFTQAGKRCGLCNGSTLNNHRHNSMGAAKSAKEMGSTEKACELIAALLKAPRTQADAAEMSGICHASITHWFAALRSSGLLLQTGYAEPAHGNGPKLKLWALNPHPHIERETPLAKPGPRVYLAGPMTGLPELNFPAFNAQAHALRCKGYVVENPAENQMPEDWTPNWRSYMRLAIAQLVTCDTVALLPGWERSRGARIEAALGRDLGLRVVEVDELFRVGVV